MIKQNVEVFVIETDLDIQDEMDSKGLEEILSVDMLSPTIECRRSRWLTQTLQHA